jgi:hypothetical protein
MQRGGKRLLRSSVGENGFLLVVCFHLLLLVRAGSGQDLTDWWTLGLTVLARNYLDVYIYDKWNGKVIPDFEEGEEFEPTVCEMKEGQTSCPSYLTEADLVTLMDKNGIGTSLLLILFTYSTLPCRLLVFVVRHRCHDRAAHTNHCRP